mmetsp:Transcript_33936/g.47304  ORF Transcript_33936/g.47304 Transcript_33936/m.47304 type:complete len:380 (-) Transcript_33936:10-1149(-)
MLSRPIAGWLSDKFSFRGIFNVTIAFVIIGNAMYGSAWGMRSLMLLIGGRALAGVGGSNVDLAISYTARVTKKENRTQWIMRMQIPRMLGMVFGPVFQLLFSLLDVESSVESSSSSSNRKAITSAKNDDINNWEDNTFEPHSLPRNSWINAVTAPGYFMCVWAFALLVAVNIILEEPTKQKQGRSRGGGDSEKSCDDDGKGCKAEQQISSSCGFSNKDGRAVDHSINNDSLAAATLMPPRFEYTRTLLEVFFIQWSSFFFLGSFETVITPVTQKAFAWGALHNSLVFAIISVSLIIGAFVAETLSKYYSDAYLVFMGLALQISGCAVSIILWTPTMATWMFYLGCCWLAFTIPFVHSGSISLFTKLIKEEHIGRSQVAR